MIFFKISGYVFFKDFMNNPQTTIALTFLTLIISDIDGVSLNQRVAESVFFDPHDFSTYACTKGLNYCLLVSFKFY